MGIGQSTTSFLNFFPKSWDFCTIRSIDMGNDCMLSFTFYIDLLLKKYEYSYHFSIFQSWLNTQYSGLWDTLEMLIFKKYLIKNALEESAENFGTGFIKNLL